MYGSVVDLKVSCERTLAAKAVMASGADVVGLLERGGGGGCVALLGVGSTSRSLLCEVERLLALVGVSRETKGRMALWDVLNAAGWSSRRA